MPRSLVLGNGHVLATFDQDLLLRDLYYPYVGEEDHTTYGHKHRIGFFIPGHPFSWLNSDDWEIEPLYGDDSLIGISRMANEKLGITIEANDFVHSVKNILVRRFLIRSLRTEERELKMYCHHDFHIFGDKQKDTALYEPATNSIIHYRKNRYFLIAGRGGEEGMTSFTTGKSEYRELEGTWRDAEDGALSRNPIEQGSVDSTVEFTCTIRNDRESIVEFWLCMGTSLSEVLKLHDYVIDETTEQMQRGTRNYWKSWVNKKRQTGGTHDEKLVSLFKRSLLIIRTQTDNHGGILAANDSDIMRFNRDTYTYVWPRDGAFVSMAMDDAGYHEVTRRFFRFCCRVLSEQGYMLHKYNPDGTPGSSWHPWWKNGEMQLPIQEDETALILHAIWHHFSLFSDFEWLQEMYECFVKRAAGFMMSYREKGTNLPLSSYDPWEEHCGIFSYTSATVYAGFLAAANIAQALGHVTHAERYHTAADETREAILFHLFDETTGRFVKKIQRRDGKETERDLTPDASIMLLWKLGLLPPSDPRMSSTMKQLEESLRVRTPVGGYARYPRDFYQFNYQHSEEVPGNPWIITTLWIAQWKIAIAQSSAELTEPLGLLHWVAEKATPAGILPEQLDPHTGAHLSVAPLTWSHAVYVETFLQYVAKETEFRGNA